MIGCVDLGVDAHQRDRRASTARTSFQQTCEDLMDYAERRMRAEIARLPRRQLPLRGRHRERRHRGQALHRRGRRARPGRRDRRRLQRAARRRPTGPINATLGVSTGAAYNGILHITDPSIPKNSGCFRPIRVVAPPGQVTNVDYPGPLVAGNTETHPRLANIVIGAMAPACPSASMASERLHRHQLRLRRQPPGPRRIFRLLRHHVGRLGRALRP